MNVAGDKARLVLLAAAQATGDAGLMANSEFWRDLKPNGTFDVFGYIALVRDHYANNGVGTDYIDQLMR